MLFRSENVAPSTREIDTAEGGVVGKWVKRHRTCRVTALCAMRQHSPGAWRAAATRGVVPFFIVTIEDTDVRAGRRHIVAGTFLHSGWIAPDAAPRPRCAPSRILASNFRSQPGRYKKHAETLEILLFHDLGYAQRRHYAHQSLRSWWGLEIGRAHV